ncbi:MAG: IS1595 family transposase [Boseongicola sp.]|nr:IS1595 family transposase [Boseongicola sp.]
MTIETFLRQLTPELKQELRAVLNLEFENSLELKVNENPTNCPHCNHDKFKKCGKTRNVQRYKCLSKSCSRTFGANNKTAFYGSKKSLSTWNHYLDLMFSSQLSVRKIAKATGIHKDTAFFWRHKILHALTQTSNPELNGIVEADETYFALSYKGKNRNLPRPPHKRGKSIRKRGISKEQVCVLTAVDRSKSILLESTCLGRPTIKQVKNVLGPHIARDAILVTDMHNAYPRFAQEQGLTHHALPHRTSSNDSIHLQNINSLHGQVKRFMRPFNGVATKYLDNYMTFFQFSGEDVTEALTQRTESVTCKELTDRQMTLR